MPMKDFKQIYIKINQLNQNRCEENGGVIYCYRCMDSQTKKIIGLYETITITLGTHVSVRIPPRYYLEYDELNDRCLLLFKGISTSDTFDHWVLGDSFMKLLYLVFDADNYRIGLMTNLIALDSNHEDLLHLDKVNSIDHITVIITLLILIAALLILIIGYNLYIRRKRRAVLLNLRKRATR
jgi:hypothetical protein